MWWLKGKSEVQPVWWLKIKSIVKCAVKIWQFKPRVPQEKTEKVIPKEAGESVFIPEKYRSLPGIMLSLGEKEYKILAGPYPKMYNFLRSTIPGVKLAKEIDLPCRLSLDIPDFSIPVQSEARAALIEAFLLLKKSRVIYVGCMGGVGRTGLFLSLMLAVESCINAESDGNLPNVVAMVRGLYHAAAVETAEQEAYIQSFDVLGIANLLRDSGLFRCN